MRTWKTYPVLCRIPVSAFAACSTATGFFLAQHERLSGVLLPGLAVFLLACGASALNQWQERDRDAKMPRTAHRPLPAGDITPTRALSVSLVLISGGLLLLAHEETALAFATGFFALIWYNGVYTPLKRRTAFAAVPGAIVGALPPAVGWLAAGGAWRDPRLAAVCFLFFLWQIPHFWLLLLHYGDEYTQAGLPSLTRVLSRSQIGRITWHWIAASAVAALFLPLYGTIRTPWIYCALVPTGGWLLWSVRSLSGRSRFVVPAPLLFRKINLYLLFMMALLSLEGIVQRI